MTEFKHVHWAYEFQMFIASKVFFNLFETNTISIAKLLKKNGKFKLFK